MFLKIPKDAGPAVRFGAQVIVGTIPFVFILLAAFGLAKLVGWMQTAGAPPWMIKGSHWAELAVFGLDLFLYFLFLLSEALKFVIGLIAEWKE